MWKCPFGFVLAIIIVASSAHPAHAQYYMYYRDGSTFELTPSDTLITIRIAADHPTVSPEDIPELSEALGTSDVTTPMASGFYRYRVLGGADIDSLLLSLRAAPEIDMANPCFSSGDGDVACMSDEIVVTFLPQWSEDEIDLICAVRELLFVQRSVNTQGPHLVRCRNVGADNTLRVALDLVEDGICRFSEPNFTSRGAVLLSPADPFYPYQWFHDNADTAGADLGSEKAWEITTGSPDVTIAVVDDGFQYLTPVIHVDLDSVSYRDNYDYAGPVVADSMEDNNPSQESNDAGYEHGTAVLGLIAAGLDNDTGVVGLAPGCQIMLLKVFDREFETDNLTLTQGVRHTFEVADPPADIVNCSWRTPGGIFSAQLDSALEDAYNAGVAVFFAASAADDEMTYPGWSQWVIGVGKTDQYDLRFKGYPAGDSLDPCAPGVGLWTTDLSGQGGSNPGVWPSLENCLEGWTETYDYTCTFSGTSAASPLAAGVAALVLSRRPDFKDAADRVTHIRDILYRSSVDLGAGGWDQYYGHGRVDALRALIAVTRGDVNNDGVHNVMDVVLTVCELYRDMPPQGLHPGQADANCDGEVTLLDLVRIIDTAFRGESVPDTCFIFEGYASQ